MADTTAAAKDFVPLLPPQVERPNPNFFNGAINYHLLRDQLSITSWLALGAVLQGTLFLVIGRLALIPALAVLLYRTFIAYAMSVNWIHNTYQDGIIHNKFTAQFPDAAGQYGNKPCDSDVVVLLIGTRCNHPLGLLAPGYKQVGDYFTNMTKDLDAHAEEFGFLGMTSYLNTTDRATQSEILSVGYFSSIAGLHAFAHSPYHRVAWEWWNRTLKQHPHVSIFHETYHVPKGHWESIYVNSHISGINSTAFKYTDKVTGEDRWARPIVDASKGLLKTSAGRMARSRGEEHDQYGEDPNQMY